MMRKLRHFAGIAAVALLVATGLATAEEAQQPLAKSPTVTRKITRHVNISHAAQPRKRTTVALATQPPAEQKEHRLILQVNTNDAAAMNLALNNATNVTEYYKEAGEKVKIEVIAFGPGLHMLRDDTSPVKARIETMALSTPEVSFKACGNTQQNMHKAENKDIKLIPQAQVVPSGVVRVMQLEEKGWSYVKP
jgi:intracellular sulfur oxidation DsrE/DsrF family protein